MKNGLKLITPITSKSETVTVEKLTDIKLTGNTVYDVVAYMDDTVLIGTFRDGTFSFHTGQQPEFKSIQKMRIFNEASELLLWRNGNKLSGRTRIDGEGQQTDVVEANQILFGTTSKVLKSGYIILTEDKGTEIIMPDKQFLVREGKEEERIAIKTRNYIDYTDNAQATYSDVRFVKFIQMPEEK